MECIIQTVMFRPFTGHDVAVSIVIAVLLGCSALVSGSETAFFSLTPRNIAQLKTGRSRSGRAILKLLSVQEYLLATILIVNNLVNICIVILSNGLIDSLTDFGGAAGLEFVVKTVVVTFLLLLFGEIMPKIFASYNPLRVARMTSIPLLLLKSVFRPLAYVLIRSGSYINESVAKKRVNISIDELSNAIEMTTDQTVEERRMLSGIVGFVHTEVVEIMKPRVDIVALDLKDDFAEVRRVIIESGFSRIPVCEEGIDDVTGVLYVKDMLSIRRSTICSKSSRTTRFIWRSSSTSTGRRSVWSRWRIFWKKSSARFRTSPTSSSRFTRSCPRIPICSTARRI